MAGAPENAGIVNGMFCNGSTWTGVINYQSSGRVGIGTTSPTNTLTVTGTAFIGNASLNTGADLSVVNTNNPYVSLGNPGNGTFNIGEQGAVGPILGWDGGDMTFRAAITYNGFPTSGFAVMTIKHNGFVGIGTTSPAAQLDVAGEIRTTGNTLACSSTTAGAIRYNSSSKAFDYCGGATPAWTAFAGSSSAAGSSGQVQFNSGGALAGASGLVYASTGNVGIGTTSPSAALEIDTNTFGPGFTGLLSLKDNYSGGGALSVTLFHAPTGNATYGDALLQNGIGNLIVSPNVSGKSLEFVGGLWTNSPSMVIKDGGNVGIGTTSPAAALDVVGDIHYSGSLADVSDRRAKLAIQFLPSGQLHRIMQLAPVSFIMKNDPKQRTELGLIAQDVEPLYPDLVQTDSTGMKSMNYVSLISPVIAAMQEQQDEIRALWAGLIVAIGAAFAACFVLWRGRRAATLRL